MVGRKGDIIMTIRQNNEERLITIETVSESVFGSVESILGYNIEDLSGQDLKKFLTPRVRELLDDYLEYDDLGNDLGNVLSRTRDFGFVDKSGNKIDMNMRIQSDVCLDKDLRFMLVMSEGGISGNACIQALAEIQQHEVLEDVTGLPNRISFQNYAQVIQKFVDEGSAPASFGIIRIDNFSDILATSGRDFANSAILALVEACSSVFRDADVLGYVEDGILGVALLGATVGDARSPLSRVQSKISSNGITISIAFKEVKIGGSVAINFDGCLGTLGQNKSQINMLLDV